MRPQPIVLPAEDPRRAEREAAGWVVVARSWAAQLTASMADRVSLVALAERGRRYGDVREIGEMDVAAVLSLDVATLADYPGGVATRHIPLTEMTARVTPERRAFGIFDATSLALAVTYVDINARCAETDFTIVAPSLRRHGLGAAVKATSVLALLAAGVEVFRTGGAAENSAIRATNRLLGYEIDEEWVTLDAPERAVVRTP